jgi:hypothetical protein
MFECARSREQGEGRVIRQTVLTDMTSTEKEKKKENVQRDKNTTKL